MQFPDPWAQPNSSTSGDSIRNLSYSPSLTTSRKGTSLSNYAPSLNLNPFLNSGIKKRWRQRGSSSTIVEIQIMGELIQALDDLIELWEGNSEEIDEELEKILNEGELRDLEEQSDDSMIIKPSPRKRREGREAVEPLLEIYSLVEEFCDLCPRARVCFSNGLYGPLSFSSQRNGKGSMTLEKGEAEQMGQDWPRRLRNDLLMLDKLVEIRIGNDSDTAYTPEGSRRGSNDSNFSYISNSSETRTKFDVVLPSKERTEELLREGRLRWIEWQRRNPSEEERGF